MPWLWITSAVVVLALGGPGRAQTAAVTDSLIGAPVGADSLSQVAEPVAPDSLPASPAQADSLSQNAAPPVLPPAAVSAVPTSPASLPGPLPVADSLPRWTRYEAQRRGFFTIRTVWAAACLGGSAMLYNQGSDYRQKADDLYARYKEAADPTEIESLYQRTTNQDTKGQVCWALGAALAVNGVRLLLTHETEITAAAAASRSSLQMILTPQSLQLRVRKWL